MPSASTSTQASRRQAIPPAQRYTLRQFQARFPTDDACLDYLMNERWHGCLVLCVNCDTVLKHHKVSGRTCYACQRCGGHVFPLAGTIFHKTTTPLTTWFYVIYLMSATRAGVSAKQIQRETGVTYKTAWRMMRQVRQVMAETPGTTLAGPLEIDEAAFGGSDSNRPKHLRGKAEKVTVLGMVERGGAGRGKVVARVIEDATKESVLPVVAEVVQPKAMIYTDGAAVYEQVKWMGQSHKHKAVNHAAGQYRDGSAHTNSVEGFWSLVKRGISGVYYQVGAAYLQSYLNEYAFRYNRRKVMRPMVSMLLERTPTVVVESARERRLTGRGSAGTRQGSGLPGLGLKLLVADAGEVP